MNKRMIGSAYEDSAAMYLQRNGYQIIERNFRCKMGEIDIICRKNQTLHFVEVKYRADETYGNAAETVSAKKLRKIYQCAQMYLLKHQEYASFDASFDVLAITENQIQLYSNCYGGI